MQSLTNYVKKKNWDFKPVPGVFGNIFWIKHNQGKLFMSKKCEAGNVLTLSLSRSNK